MVFAFVLILAVPVTLLVGLGAVIASYAEA